MSKDNWKVFDLAEIRQRLKGQPVEYQEFLKVPALSCGLYRLVAGSRDMQAPHDDDEVYLVLEGRARMRLGDEAEKVVGPGALLYVSATTEHSFFEVEEDMLLLVFFASNN
ncbi:MAG: cupin [Haliea sp.]|jgi:mannose-6-phosphate isomerase-like protein (cupin superfamily)|nr:cupin [Haliea sp.]MAL96577.1 cupin [Haliea sp.]|tara:strand:- start:218 stop:550 length:333 start_codon:yes stop_codon:yes gene_type:complete